LIFDIAIAITFATSIVVTIAIVSSSIAYNPGYICHEECSKMFSNYVRLFTVATSLDWSYDKATQMITPKLPGL
jgi:hypothetical protein